MKADMEHFEFSLAIRDSLKIFNCHVTKLLRSALWPSWAVPLQIVNIFQTSNYWEFVHIIFLVMITCTLVVGYKCFERTYCLHFQGTNMESVFSSETMVSSYQTIRFHNPWDHNLYFYTLETFNLILGFPCKVSEYVVDDVFAAKL